MLALSVPIPTRYSPVNAARSPRVRLGQTAAAPPVAPSVSPAGGPAANAPNMRLVQVSREEGQLLIKVTENLVSFAQNYPVEFNSYCPPERWQAALTQVGTWTHEIERQLNAGAQSVAVPADAVFRLVDIEKCISSARDARLDGAKLAFTLSAVGTIANFVLGLTWITIPTYIAGLAILFGRPLMARLNPTPQEPYKPVLSGRSAKRHHCLGGECQLIAMKLREEEKDNPNRRKVLERVVVCPDVEIEKHYWGTVRPRPGGAESAVCLKKDRFRVRVEGWEDDIVVPSNGWSFTDPEDCNGNIVLAVWSPDTRATEDTGWGEVSQDSGHDNTYWVEYVGPLTGGKIRRAGPFGCTGDPAEHAKDDAGFEKRGVDGDYAIFDQNGEAVDEENEGH